MSDNALAALNEECNALLAVLRELEPIDFSRATNCPPWNLRELVVHIADSIRLGDAPFPSAEALAAVNSAADYYRRPERDTPAYRQSNVDRTQDLARRLLAGTPATDLFDDVSRHTISTLREYDSARVVMIPGRGAMKLADWVTTRVVSVAVHGLDVAITADRPPWTTPAATHVVRPVFVSLLGTQPPDALDWDDRTFLATATGRRTLTDRERGLLGSRATAFPLLS